MLTVKQEIGRLDRRITFQRAVYSTDASNQRVVTGWTNITTSPQVYAQVSENSGNEVIQAEQLNGLKSSVFTVRYRADLKIENRIVFGSEVYDIRVMLEIGRKRYLKIVAEAGGQYTPGGSDDAWVISTGIWNDDEHWDDDGIWNDGV